MMDHTLRRVKDVVYTPLARQMGKSVHPIPVTLIAGAVGIFSAIAGWQGASLAGLLLWWANRALDGLDGAIARANGTQTDLGGYIDTMMDFTIYSIIPFGLALRAPSLELLAALAFMLVSFYINAGSFLYLSAVLESRSQGAQQRRELTSVTMPGGLIEGAEAILFYSLFFLFTDSLAALYLILGVLVIFTTLQRIVWASRNLR